MQRVLVLPGIADPKHKDYRGFYRAIVTRARKRAGTCWQVAYPGQNGEGSGRLSFETAMQAAEREALELKPDWVIGIPFGALVTLALARGNSRGFEKVKGLVLLGPTTRGGMRRKAPDEKARKKAFENYRVKYNTWLGEQFFKTLRPADVLIKGVKLPVRLIRGEHDEYNSAKEFRALCERYQSSGCGTWIETFEIPGAEHVVVPRRLNAEGKALYEEGLFEKIG